MPSRPLTNSQKADAARLRALFMKWRHRQPGVGGRAESMESIAARIGHKQSAFSQRLNGTMALNLKSAVDFAQLLGCQVRDFSPTLADELEGLSDGLSRPPEPSFSPIAERNGQVNVPLLNVQASMGLGVGVPEHLEIIRHISLDIDQLRKVASFSNPKNLSFITGYGNSMEPTFADGDTLLIDQGITDVRFDAVYALEKGDELFIKRIQRRADGTLLMLSDNKLYEPQTISKADLPTFRVRGRVVLVWNARKV